MQGGTVSVVVAPTPLFLFYSRDTHKSVKHDHYYYRFVAHGSDLSDPNVKENGLWVLVLGGVDVDGLFLPHDPVGVVHMSEDMDLGQGGRKGRSQQPPTAAKFTTDATK